MISKAELTFKLRVLKQPQTHDPFLITHRHFEFLLNNQKQILYYTSEESVSICVVEKRRKGPSLHCRPAEHTEM